MAIKPTSYITKLLLLFLASMLAFPMMAQSAQHLGLKTVVIDPGHGGKDPGAPGKSSSTSEKHIVLAISKLLGNKIKAAYPDVKVVYTRSTDVFVELNQRANIAKKSNADLFISIHCNSNNSSRPFGASAHILGPKSKNKKNTSDYFAKSKSVAQRENSVMLLEDDYQTTYQGFDPNAPESVISHNLMWNANYENSLLFAAEVDNVITKTPFRESDYTGIHQDIFYLLWATNMPSALLELGFMSNPLDYKVLSTKDGQEKIAQSLFDAFSAYKTKFDASVNVKSDPIVAPVPQAVQPDVTETAEPAEAASEVTSDEYYGVQIMALGRKLAENDPNFKGYKAVAVNTGKIYKYIIGAGATKEEVVAKHKDIKKKFPESFVVKVSGNTVERAK